MIDENQEIIFKIDKRVNKLMPLDYNPELRASYDRVSSTSKLLNKDMFNYRDFFHELKHMNSN